jgi:NADH-quinone oxidoreductase subunit N
MRYDLSIPGQLAAALTPDLILMGGAMVLLLVAVWRKESTANDRFIGRLALMLVAITAAAVGAMLWIGTTATPGLIAVDRFRWIVDLLVLLATAIAIALCMDDNRREGIALGEGYVMVLFAAAGMMVLAASQDLIMVFLGIEMMSIAVYVLAGLNRRSARAAEASLKYFLLGAFATGFLLYGIALVYGATGSTQFGTIGHQLAGSRAPSPLLLVGIGMLVVGFGFKVAAVPFHMWTPDVYDGSPTPFTAFMAAGVKVAAFAALMRLWADAFAGIRSNWVPVFWWLAAATMIVGNLVALQQKSVKRMLAYSSIAHAGYLLVAIASGSIGASPTLLFYMLAYTLATMGAFAVVVALSRPGERGQQISDLEGLWQVRPWLAAAMAVFMLSLLGFPIAGGMGFWAKWYVLQTVVSAATPQIALAVILVLTSVVSAGYYLGIVLAMYMKPRAPDALPVPSTPGLTGTIIALSAAALLVFGVQPGLLAKIARDSTPVPAYLHPPGLPDPVAPVRR